MILIDIKSESCWKFRFFVSETSQPHRDIRSLGERSGSRSRELPFVLIVDHDGHSSGDAPIDQRLGFDCSGTNDLGWVGSACDGVRQFRFAGHIDSDARLVGCHDELITLVRLAGKVNQEVDALFGCELAEGGNPVSHRFGVEQIDRRTVIRDDSGEILCVQKLGHPIGQDWMQRRSAGAGKLCEQVFLDGKAWVAKIAKIPG